MKSIRLKGIAIVAGVLLLLGMISGPAFGAEPVKGKVMIYSSIYLHIIEQLKPILKKKFPNIDVQWFYGGSEKVIAKLVAEFEQGNTMADLIMIADPAYYNTLKRDGRLLQYRSPNHKYLFPAWVDKDGYYSGVRINIMGIAYNKNLVAAKDLPKTWWDLADPKWRGKVGMPNPAPFRDGLCGHGGPCPLAETRLALLRSPPEKPLPANPATAPWRRNCSAASSPWRMLLEENVLKAISEKKPLGFVYPSDGPIVNPPGIAIMKTTKNPAAAKAVYDFFLSKEGQQAIIDGWMHSVRTDMPPPKNAALTIRDDQQICPAHGLGCHQPGPGESEGKI